MSGGLAIVTGAAAGTGLALARRLAADGFQVVLADVDEDAGREAAEGIRGARFARADMTERGDVERLLADADGLRVLVNNAGGWIGDAQFPDAPFEDWSRALDLNLRGPMLATQLAIGPMRRAGGGVVVNVASSAGNESTPYASPEYGTAKAGLIRFTTALGDLEGVRVNCIVLAYPGADPSPVQANAVQQRLVNADATGARRQGVRPRRRRARAGRWRGPARAGRGPRGRRRARALARTRPGSR